MSGDRGKITWSDELSIDQSLIDADHKFIFQQVDDFIARGEQFRSAEEAHELVHRLSAYASIHFRREEYLHSQINYPHAEAHRNEHLKIEDGFVEIQHLVMATDVSQLGFVSDMMGNLIRDWLHTHIRNYDVPMQQFAAELRRNARDIPDMDEDPSG